MSFQHKEMAAGRWQTMSFLDQMGNLGSEVNRTINWKNKADPLNKQSAFERALELFDLTIQDKKNTSKLRELTRLRETFVDYIQFNNQYGATDALWQNYFLAFGIAARNASGN